MKRLLSTILALALGLGAVPAQAQMALGQPSLPSAMSAPTPVPGGIVPVAGSFSPSLSAPALSVSLTPAPYVSLIPAAVPVLPAAPIHTPARGETPLETLRTFASPDISQRANAIFDGSTLRSAAASVEPSPEPASAASPKKLSLLARYRVYRNQPPTPFSTFGKSLVFSALAATAAPIVLNAAPSGKLVYALAAVTALLLTFLIPAGITHWAARKFRRAPQTAAKPPPSKRKMIAMVVLGAVLGMGLGITPYAVTGPVVERGAIYLDQTKAAAEQSHARWITGGAVESETIKELSRNPIGRATLDALRDRFGVLRLPTFFVSQQEGSYAQHENMFDGVYINQSEITERGWTVEQFLTDPALQRQLVREMNSTIVHELTHAVQGRRPAWTPGYFKNAMEAEQEAFFQEMLFRLAELEADPSARNNGTDQWMVPDAADSIDGFLKSVAEMYEKNVVIG
ncbi:MAG: hypothetical protein ABL955_05185, partial [Elusimicrobiota bacterium]